jgi:hypothetical protein
MQTHAQSATCLENPSAGASTIKHYYDTRSVISKQIPECLRHWCYVRISRKSCKQKLAAMTWPRTMNQGRSVRGWTRFKGRNNECSNQSWTWAT